MKVKTNFFPTPVHVVIVTSSQKSQMFLMASGMVNPLQKLLVTLLTPTRGIMIHGNHKFSSVAQSCLTLCNPMDCSTPGLPVHHQLPEFNQTQVHGVGDAIQPSHPLSSPSPAFSLSQHQGLFKWVSSLHWVAKVLEFQLQHQSFQWIFRTDFV